MNSEEYLKSLPNDHPVWDIEDDHEYTERQLIDFAQEYHENALKNMESSSRVSHSQPNDGFNYWIRQDDEWKVAEARHCRIYNRIMLFTTNGARVDPKYCDWRANPLPIPKG